MPQVIAGKPPSSTGQVSTVKHLDPLRKRDFFLGLSAPTPSKRGGPGVLGVEGIERGSLESIFSVTRELRFGSTLNFS